MIQFHVQHQTPRRAPRLPADRVRHLIESLRLQCRNGGNSYAVIVIDCQPTPEHPVHQIFQEIDWLDELIAADWAHDKQVGWLTHDLLVIVLPNATTLDAWEYRDQIKAHCHLQHEHLRVFADSPTSLAVARDEMVAVLGIDGLLVRRVPTWKRLVDLAGGTIGLLLALPIILLAGICIKVTSRGPVFFRQERVGQGGRPFSMYKLRTMRQDAEQLRRNLDDSNEFDGLGFKIANDPRVTRVGRLLRKTSLDELPQLINVLRGEMSLVGPRPLPVSDWKPTDLWMCGRHDVLPGITCTWQVAGREGVTFEEWMRMDLEYVEFHDFFLDLKLLALTVPAVLTQRGAA